MQNKDVLEEGKIITSLTVIEKGVVVKGRKITYAGEKKKEQLPSHCRRINMEGKYVTPGFIDIHLHGGEGQDVLDGYEAVEKIAYVHTRGGTTSMILAVLTAPMEDVLAAIKKHN